MDDDLVPLHEAERQDRRRPPRVSGKDHRSGYNPIAPLSVLEPETWQGVEVPKTRWIVDNVIPAGAVADLGGHGETGKSMIALQLAVARALDRDWLGFRTERGKSLFLSCEDPPDQLHIRIAGILHHFDADFADLEDRLRIVDRTDLLNAFMQWQGRWQPGELTGLYGEIMNYAIEFGADLIVIDSRYDTFQGEQNDVVQVHEYLSALRTLATEINGAVLMLSHPSRAGLEGGDGQSGSVGWHNKVRSRLYLRQADSERDGDCDRILEHHKSNWGQKFEAVPLKWREGAFDACRADGGMVESIERGVIERDFLDGLDRLAKQGRHPSDSPNSPRYAPKMMRQDLRMRHSVRQLRDAMNRLFEGEEIIVGNVADKHRNRAPAVIRNPKNEARKPA